MKNNFGPKGLYGNSTFLVGVRGQLHASKLHNPKACPFFDKLYLDHKFIFSVRVLACRLLHTLSLPFERTRDGQV